MSSKNRRTRFLIKKGLQFRYMAVILLTMLFLTLICGWTIYFTIWSRLTSGDLRSISDLPKVFTVINHDLLVRIPIFAVLLSFASLFISHRIAGPIYRFEESAKTISNGDLTLRVKLRKGDELHYLAECFNQMTQNLETIVAQDRTAISRIIKVIKEIPVELKSHNLPQSRKSEVVDELIKIVDTLKSITCTFKIEESLVEACDTSEEGQDTPCDICGTDTKELTGE